MSGWNDLSDTIGRHYEQFMGKSGGRTRQTPYRGNGTSQRYQRYYNGMQRLAGQQWGARVDPGEFCRWLQRYLLEHPDKSLDQSTRDRLEQMSPGTINGWEWQSLILETLVELDD